MSKLMFVLILFWFLTGWPVL